TSALNGVPFPRFLRSECLFYILSARYEKESGRGCSRSLGRPCQSEGPHSGSTPDDSAEGDSQPMGKGERKEAMIAAVYARKSTEQSGVADEQKSVARQVDHARAYATRKDWTVDEASIFVDDGVSGAEFAKRPGYCRLMDALRPRPQFQVLVMSEE